MSRAPWPLLQGGRLAVAVHQCPWFLLGSPLLQLELPWPLGRFQERLSVAQSSGEDGSPLWPAPGCLNVPCQPRLMLLQLAPL